MKPCSQTVRYPMSYDQAKPGHRVSTREVGGALGLRASQVLNSSVLEEFLGINLNERVPRGKPRVRSHEELFQPYLADYEGTCEVALKLQRLSLPLSKNKNGVATYLALSSPTPQIIHTSAQIDGPG